MNEGLSLSASWKDFRTRESGNDFDSYYCSDADGNTVYEDSGELDTERSRCDSPNSDASSAIQERDDSAEEPLSPAPIPRDEPDMESISPIEGIAPSSQAGTVNEVENDDVVMHLEGSSNEDEEVDELEEMSADVDTSHTNTFEKETETGVEKGMREIGRQSGESEGMETMDVREENQTGGVVEPEGAHMGSIFTPSPSQLSNIETAPEMAIADSQRSNPSGVPVAPRQVTPKHAPMNASANPPPTPSSTGPAKAHSNQGAQSTPAPDPVQPPKTASAPDPQIQPPSKPPARIKTSAQYFRSTRPGEHTSIGPAKFVGSPADKPSGSGFGFHGRPRGFSGGNIETSGRRGSGSGAKVGAESGGPASNANANASASQSPTEATSPASTNPNQAQVQLPPTKPGRKWKASNMNPLQCNPNLPLQPLTRRGEQTSQSKAKSQSQSRKPSDDRERVGQSQSSSHVQVQLQPQPRYQQPSQPQNLSRPVTQSVPAPIPTGSANNPQSLNVDRPGTASRPVPSPSSAALTSVPASTSTSAPFTSRSNFSVGSINHQTQTQTQVQRPGPACLPQSHTSLKSSSSSSV